MGYVVARFRGVERTSGAHGEDEIETAVFLNGNSLQHPAELGRSIRSPGEGRVANVFVGDAREVSLSISSFARRDVYSFFCVRSDAERDVGKWLGLGLPVNANPKRKGNGK